MGAGIPIPRAAAQNLPGPATQPAVTIPWRARPDDAPSSQPAEPVEDLAATDPAPAAQPPAAPLFNELSFHLGAEGEWHRRRVRTYPRGSDRLGFEQTNRTQSISEVAGVHAAGQLFNERVCRYSFNVEGGFSQERYSELRPGRDLQDSPDGSELRYDGRATFFPAGKITANVFAARLDDRVPRMFLPSLDRDRERYGAELLYNDRTLPMRLAFEDTYERLSSYTRSLDDEERRGDRRLEYEANWQPSERHQTRFNYEYDDSRERYSGTATTYDRIRNYLTLNDTHLFGLHDRSRLDTVARFQDESGDLARDVAELAPQLRLQHTDSFATTYRAQYLRETYQDIELQHARGEIGLAHQLDDWLTSSANIYGLTSQANQGSDVSEWGGIATTALNRANANGRLSANLTYNHASQRADAATGDAVVLNEALTLRDPLPALLAHPDVRPFSILVLSADGRRPLLPGRDYLVLRLGRYTSLARVPTGNIADGQTVLVSYRYRVAQLAQLNRDRIDFRIQQAFNSGWVPYYAASLQNEDVDRTRYLSYEPRDINRQRLGVDYRQARWSAGTEFEYNNDAVDPYLALHLRGDATVYRKAPHELSARGNGSFFHFAGGDFTAEHDVALLDVGMSYRLILDSRWEANAAATYRFEHDSLSGITHGVDVSGSLNYKIGQFTALFELEYNQLRLPGSNDCGFSAWIKLRRDIPVLGSAR